MSFTKAFLSIAASLPKERRCCFNIFASQDLMFSILKAQYILFSESILIPSALTPIAVINFEVSSKFFTFIGVILT